MDLITSIGKTLRSRFPDKVIYRNRQEAGFKEDSFYIILIASRSNEHLFNHQLREYRVVVKYFPPMYPAGEAQKTEEKCFQMGEELMTIKYLEDMSAILKYKDYEIVGGELSFKFTIKTRVKFEESPIEDNDEFMRRLRQEVEVE